MSKMTMTNATAIQSLKKRGALLALGVFLLFAQLPGQGQGPAPDALKFFKNYFITGDYVVAGVNLRGEGDGSGFATGEIHFPAADVRNTVPGNADILAAFLFWESVIKQDAPASGYSGARFRDQLLQTDEVVPQTLAYELNPAGTAPCWSSGGGTGASGGAHRMKAYRADVLRFLPIGTDPTKPNYGKRLVNDQDLLDHGAGFHTVTMPEPGSGNQVPSTAGASLVVIYRDTREDVDATTAGLQRPALRSVVIYNGGWTMDQSTDFMSQNIKGFYQASSASPVAKMTHIVGDGQPNFSEQVQFKSDSGPFSVIEASPGPFNGAASPSADPAWDNWTYYDLPLSGGAAEATVRVDHGSFTPFDCLSWGAIILSTTVQDVDDDGIVDKWETSRSTTGPVVDPNGQPLPDLFAMGAGPDKKDVFVEIGYLNLNAADAYSNPFQGLVSAHDHLPAKEALDMVGSAFANAPVSNPAGTSGIRVHFDVGSNHQTIPADPYIIPSSLARGGEVIDEIDDTGCVASATQACLFPEYPGTVGWKTAFRFLRDQPLRLLTNGVPEAGAPTENACVAAETDIDAPEPGVTTTCERRFDRTRKDIFHYALFAHALGVQRLDDPNTTTVDESLHADIVAGGVRDPIDCDLVPIVLCAVPSGVSGTGDGGGSGGGDLMITLGFWDNFKGTPFIQASTLMHELGHNFGFRHGAGPPAVTITPATGTTPETVTITALPNCKPNYQSVMNYLFQIRGLIVGQANSPVAGFTVGAPVIDYSRQNLPGGSGVLSETSLTEQPTALPGMLYRTGWYSPSSLLDENLGTARARRHCDGTFLNAVTGVVEPGSFRITGTSLTSIDWNADLIIQPTPFVIASQDINFNGGPSLLVGGPATDGPFSGSNDWAIIDLRQVGSRRNVASDAVCDDCDFFGPLSLDQGVGDNGVGDNGVGDNGVGDNGVGDNGVGDNGVGDNGVGDNGVGDNGVGDNGAPAEVDLDTAKALGNTPNTLTASVVSKNILLTWFAPHVRRAEVDRYEVWRVVGQTVDSATWLTRVMVGTKLPPWPPAQITFTDLSAKNNVWYTYFVVAIDDVDKSGPSNYVTIKK